MVDRINPENEAESSTEGETFARITAADEPWRERAENKELPSSCWLRKTDSSLEAVLPAPLPVDPTTPCECDACSPFGAALGPVLEKACEGRLHSLRWFRTDWQRGGALTGYAVYINGGGIEHPVVVKLPVPPIERFWLTQLQTSNDVVPKVYAHGESLGGYDMAWVVMERLPHGPIGLNWGGDAVDLVVDAACRFYAEAEGVEVRHPRNGQKDWHAVLKESRHHIGRHTPHQRRWKDALKKAGKRLDDWLEIWNQRSVAHWCHGDLHLGNAMTRNPAPEGPAVLFDFARSRPGHWVEDAVYFESLFWSNRQRLGDRRLCSMIAKGRRNRGLDSEDNWVELAAIRRGLIAMSAPAIAHEADPAYLEACIEKLEQAVAA